MEEHSFRRLLILFRSFFVISAVTLGGGMTMLPVMQDEFVRKRKWLTDTDMVDTVAMMQSMPGIIASNMATLIGYRVAGVPGAVVSVLGATLPPYISISLLANIVERIRDCAAVQHIFLGVRSALAALILLSVYSLGKKLFEACPRRLTAVSATIAVLAFSCMFFINAIWVVIGAAAAGIAVTLCLREQRDDVDGRAG
jgi:chromate transporter